jgi:hypothetical protein
MSEDAQSGHVQEHLCGDGDVQAEPGHSQGAKDVAVAKSKGQAVGCIDEGDELVRPGVDLGRCLAAGAAITEDLPARM